MAASTSRAIVYMGKARRLTAIGLAMIFLLSCREMKAQYNPNQAGSVELFFPVQRTILVSQEPSMRTPVLHADRDNTYILTDTPDSGHSILVYQYGKHDERHHLFRLPSDLNIGRRSPVQDFAFKLYSDSIAAFLLFKRLLIYDLRNSEWELIRDQDLEYAYQSIRLIGDTCALSVCRYGDRLTDSIGTRIAFLNLSSGSLNERVLPEPSGRLFTVFQPRRIIDVNSRWVVIGEADRYSLRFYDHDMQPIDTVEHTQSQMHQSLDVPIITSELRRSSSPEIIATLSATLKQRWLMMYVQFIDDTTLVVVWQDSRTAEKGLLKGKQQMFFDIWRHSSGEWNLLAHDLERSSPPLESTVATAWPMQYALTFDGPILLGLEPMPIDISTMTWGEASAAVEAYYVDHDIRSTIIRRVWQPLQ